VIVSSSGSCKFKISTISVLCRSEIGGNAMQGDIPALFKLQNMDFNVKKRTLTPVKPTQWTDRTRSVHSHITKFMNLVEIRYRLGRNTLQCKVYMHHKYK